MYNAYCIRGKQSPVINEYMNTVEQGIRKAGINIDNIGLVFNNLDKSRIIVSDEPTVAIQYIIRGFKNHIVWFQGVLPEESYMRRKSKARYIVLSIIEKIVLKKAKILIMVSKSMLEHYEKKYNMKLESKSIIIPCYIDSQVYKDSFERKDAGQEPEFVYVGGMQEWQCFEETVEIYQRVEKKLQGHCHLFVYSKEPEKAKNIIQKTHIKNYMVTYVKPEELHNRLCTANYGFILRHDETVNNVATPTKLSNYIANGIVPIYTYAIKSFADLDKKIQLGIPCKMEDPEKAAETIVNRIKTIKDQKAIERKCYAFFDDYYSKDKNIEKVCRIVSHVFEQ